MSGSTFAARRSEILIGRIFFSDSPDGKARPCIVLSSERYNSQGYFLVVPITSANDEFCLPMEKKDYEGFLFEGSMARFDCVVKMPSSQAIKRIGKVKSEFYGRLVEKIISMVR